MSEGLTRAASGGTHDVCGTRRVAAGARSVNGTRTWPNDIKLSRDGHQPENNPGQRGQAGGLAGFAGLVPAAGALGLAFVAAAGAGGYEVAGEGDLEGQIGGDVVEVVRGKSIRSR